MGPPALKIAFSRSFCGAGKGTGVREMARAKNWPTVLRNVGNDPTSPSTDTRQPSGTIPVPVLRKAWPLLPGEGELGGGGYGLAKLLPGTNREAQLGFDACEPGGDFLAVGFGSVG